MIADLAELRGERSRWRTDGRRLVLTNGCFDLLHVGHVRSLAAARSFGDVLVVGINGDASVRALKGPGRPLVPASERAEIVASLAVVDQVVVFEEATAVALVEALCPDLYVKGGDYGPRAVSGRPLPEEEAVRRCGGAVRFTAFEPGHSTSELASRLGRVGRADAAGTPE